MRTLKFLFYALLGCGLLAAPSLADDTVPKCDWDPPTIKNSQQSLTVVTEDGTRTTRSYNVQEASCKLLSADKCGEDEKFAGFGGSFTEDGEARSATPVCCGKDTVVKFGPDDKSGFWTCRNSLGLLTVTVHSDILCCPKICPEDDPKKQAEIAEWKSQYAKCQSKNDISTKLLIEHGLWPLSQVVSDECGCPKTILNDPCNVNHQGLPDGTTQPERCFSDGSCGITCPFNGPCRCGEGDGCQNHIRYTCDINTVNYSDPPECCDGAYQTCESGCAIQNAGTFLGDC